MNVGTLKDWLRFVDEIAAKAEDVLIELGFPREDLPTLTLLHTSKAHHLDYVTGRGDPDRKRAAFGVLVLRERIRQQALRVRENPEEAAAQLAALGWKLHMVGASLYADLLEPSYFSTRQSKRGADGARVRWQGTETIADIVKTLAKQRDELGDYLDPSELWPELFAALDVAALHPVEEAAPLRYAYGDGKSITYEAFRKRIQRRRD